MAPDSNHVTPAQAETTAANARGVNAANNVRVAVAAGSVACLMVGMAFAAVPLYDLFCRVTGYGGTTQVAAAAPEAVSDRLVTIRFDASLNRDMPWRFEAPAEPITLRVGESGLVFYKARNLADTTVTGTATFNVSPQKAGYYFSKIDCFCFTEQALEPGQEMDMPVTFFVDPEILEDPEMAAVTTITLSYTFFESKKTAQSEATSAQNDS